MESSEQKDRAGRLIPEAQSPQEEATSKKSAAPNRIILRGVLLGAAVGLLLPLTAIIFRIIGCHYTLAHLSDISSAAGMCLLPALVAGAVLSGAAASIGESIGVRADRRMGSTHRANRGGWIGTGIGIFLSLVIGAVMALMLMFPDC